MRNNRRRVWQARGRRARKPDDGNSVLFDDFENTQEALITAVENADPFYNDNDNDMLHQEFSDASMQRRLRSYFTQLYEGHGQTLDGMLINTDNLTRRLPAHSFYPQIVWGNVPKFRLTTTDIVDEEMPKTFLDWF